MKRISILLSIVILVSVVFTGCECTQETTSEIPISPKTLDEQLLYDKAIEYFTQEYVPLQSRQYEAIEKNGLTFISWESAGTTIICQATRSSGGKLLGWTFVILTPEPFRDKAEIEYITSKFFKKEPIPKEIEFKDFGADGYWGVGREIREEGAYVYNLAGYPESFDVFEINIDKLIKNVKTELQYGLVTKDYSGYEDVGLLFGANFPR